MKYLLCLTVWELALRNAVNKNTNYLWNDRKEKQPDIKPGTTFHSAGKDVMGMQLRKISLWETFKELVQCINSEDLRGEIRERNKLGGNSARGIPKGKGRRRQE